MSIADGSHDHEPRFLTDVNFNARILVGLRRIAPTVDLITAQSAGFHTTPDPELLAEARQLDRILLTHDINTMPDHFATFLAGLPEGEHSPGVMLVAQELAIGIAIQELYEVWSCSNHEEWRDTFTYLPL
ncbi:MAG TPA: DUF5615 family PIN-like protein [Ktedonobacterales bacterium]|jgi:hypothetical protein|nr:DUF5615 family PIN-like protein [Ktedonobacterales bacterium]